MLPLIASSGGGASSTAAPNAEGAAPTEGSAQGSAPTVPFSEVLSHGDAAAPPNTPLDSTSSRQGKESSSKDKSATNGDAQPIASQQLLSLVGLLPVAVLIPFPTPTPEVKAGNITAPDATTAVATVTGQAMTTGFSPLTPTVPSTATNMLGNTVATAMQGQGSATITGAGDAEPSQPSLPISTQGSVTSGGGTTSAVLNAQATASTLLATDATASHTKSQDSTVGAAPAPSKEQGSVASAPLTGSATSADSNIMLRSSSATGSPASTITALHTEAATASSMLAEHAGNAQSSGSTANNQKNEGIQTSASSINREQDVQRSSITAVQAEGQVVHAGQPPTVVVESAAGAVPKGVTSKDGAASGAPNARGNRISGAMAARTSASMSGQEEGNVSRNPAGELLHSTVAERGLGSGVAHEAMPLPTDSASHANGASMHAGAGDGSPQLTMTLGATEGHQSVTNTDKGHDVPITTTLSPIAEGVLARQSALRAGAEATSFHIVLQPQALGMVTVHVEHGQAGLQVTLTPQRTETQQLLDKHIPELISLLTGKDGGAVGVNVVAPHASEAQEHSGSRMDTAGSSSSSSFTGQGMSMSSDGGQSFGQQDTQANQVWQEAGDAVPDNLIAASTTARGPVVAERITSPRVSTTHVDIQV